MRLSIFAALEASTMFLPCLTSISLDKLSQSNEYERETLSSYNHLQLVTPKTTLEPSMALNTDSSSFKSA
jgi:hypothetical protein